MRIEDMNDIQIEEMTLRWNIEYEESYLNSLKNDEVVYPENTSNQDKITELYNAENRVKEAKEKYRSFIDENAEEFI